MSGHKRFWNKEYEGKRHLSLSTNPSEDLEKFVRWQLREDESWRPGFTLDVGCGNGRNLIYLAREYGATGYGFDIADTAIAEAKKHASGMKLSFEVRSLEQPLPLPDGSVDCAIDMMSSHFLDAAGRARLRDELARVIVPGGWLLFKSFLLDEDEHAARLLREHPGAEPGTYIHPEIGVPEHVWTEEEVRGFFPPAFELVRFRMSHLHRLHGKAFKRRYFVAYLRKSW